ncbi:hypothetical protein GGF32_002698 [Allomyces javanicus]|nr:hypothetical protein GGF32_002698 [Allomyces javanicus]
MSDRPIVGISRLSKRELWEQVADRFHGACDLSEACWLRQKKVMAEIKSLSPRLYESIMHFSLKPKATKNARDWLSTIEISFVMQQYEKVYPRFVFLGCVPSDWFEIHPNKRPTKDLFRQFDHAAIVFNLDTMKQSGSHWYFDPVGEPPIPRIKSFLDSLTFGRVYVSDRQHQRSGFACGYYSLYYILQRLKGQTMASINERRIPDGDMLKFRKEVFRPHNA